MVDRRAGCGLGVALGLSVALAASAASGQEEQDRDHKTIACEGSNDNKAEVDCPAGTQHAVCECESRTEKSWAWLTWAWETRTLFTAKCACAEGGIRPGADPPAISRIASLVPESSPDVPTVSSSPAYERSVPFHWTRLGLSLDLSPLGVTISDRGRLAYSLLARPRIGVEHGWNEHILFFQATYEVSLLEVTDFGLMIGARAKYGFGGEAGLRMSVDGHPGAMAALTYLAFGIEARREGFAEVGSATSLLLKVSFPIWHLYVF